MVKEITANIQHSVNQDCFNTLQYAIEKMRDAKPSDRSELDRRFAVAITEAEKLQAYFWTYIMNENVI